MEGTGVAPVRIPKVDKLARVYVQARDTRIESLNAEVNAKSALVEALHFHSAELTLPDGRLVYHYDDNVITLEPGKEKLSVKASHVADEGED